MHSSRPLAGSSLQLGCAHDYYPLGPHHQRPPDHCHIITFGWPNHLTDDNPCMFTLFLQSCVRIIISRKMVGSILSANLFWHCVNQSKIVLHVLTYSCYIDVSHFYPDSCFQWDVSTCTNSNMACNSYQLYHHVLKVPFFQKGTPFFYILHTNSLKCSYFDRLKRLGCFWLIVPSVQTIYPPKIDICSPRFTFSNVAMDNSPFSSMISPIYIYIHNIIKQHVACDCVYIYIWIYV